MIFWQTKFISIPVRQKLDGLTEFIRSSQTAAWLETISKTASLEYDMSDCSREGALLNCTFSLTEWIENNAFITKDIFYNVCHEFNILRMANLQGLIREMFSLPSTDVVSYFYLLRPRAEAMTYQEAVLQSWNKVLLEDEYWRQACRETPREQLSRLTDLIYAPRQQAVSICRFEYDAQKNRMEIPLMTTYQEYAGRRLQYKLQAILFTVFQPQLIAYRSLTKQGEKFVKFLLKAKLLTKHNGKLIKPHLAEFKLKYPTK